MFVEVFLFSVFVSKFIISKSEPFTEIWYFIDGLSFHLPYIRIFPFSVSVCIRFSFASFSILFQDAIKYLWLSAYRMESEKWENPWDKIPKFAFTEYIQRLHQFNRINKKNERQQNDWLEFGTCAQCTILLCIRMKNEWEVGCWTERNEYSICCWISNSKSSCLARIKSEWMHKQNITIGTWNRFNSIQFNCYIPQSTFILPIHTYDKWTTNNQRWTTCNTDTD